jgi:hypothetical protein
MKKERLQLKVFLPGVLLFAVILMPLEAGTITTSVTCSTNVGDTNNAAACSILGAGTLGTGHADASVSASYVLSATALTTTAQASADASPSVDLVSGNEAASYAASSATITLDLDTAGSARPGVVLIDWNASTNGCCGMGGGSVSYNLGSGIGGNCGAPPATVCSYSVFEPITLGSDFAFTETEQFTATTLDEHEGGSLQANLSLQFFEANGETPVDVFETPEPGPLGLAAVGLLFLLGGRLRRRGAGRAT